jgi:pyruvate/2-oxoglutarate dehydrogenase complex dihydrolipoamide dehydrogenase (E3) component
VIATGARAAELPIPGLAEAGYLTNESVFSLTELPARIVVVGAGPIGCEMAQSFRRLGSQVTIVSLDDDLLPREDQDAATVLKRQFEQDGIELCLEARLQRVDGGDEGSTVVFDRGDGPEEVVCDQVLVAVGRTPNTAGMGSRLPE